MVTPIIDLDFPFIDSLHFFMMFESILCVKHFFHTCPKLLHRMVLKELRLWGETDKVFNVDPLGLKMRIPDILLPSLFSMPPSRSVT